MKKNMFCIAIAMLATLANSAETAFYQDLSNACARAQTENKSVLLCLDLGPHPGLRDLTQEVIAAPAFMEYAATNFVILTPTLRGEFLRDITRKYELISFPAVILLDAQGSEIGRYTGYLKGTGPDKYIALLKEFQETKLGWTVGKRRAEEKARKEGKMLMIYFFGMGNAERTAFTREILCHPKFAEYAKKNLILDFVYSDILENDPPTPGLPVFSLINSQGRRLKQQARYSPGTAVEAVIAQMEEARTRN